MKKNLVLTLTLALAFAITSGAQPQLGAGVKGGINFSTQVTTGSGEGVAVRQLIGFNGGVYGNLFVTDMFGLQAELVVCTRGSDWDDPSYNVKDLLTYLDLPLLFKFQPIKYANVHIGPQFGYLLAAKQEDKDDGDLTDIKEWYNPLDVGLAFGAEANLPFRINVSVRYVLGLVSATNDVEYIEPWRNNCLQLSVGFRIIGDK
jgi:Outer membrane protein beta-barrel domain